jgi:hypothetical protein
LTRATVLRVLGRYEEAGAACAQLPATAQPVVVTLCRESLRALTGHLADSYATMVALSQQSLPPEVRAWRYSELGEMAQRLGDDGAAEHWLREGLLVAPDDLYMRASCADLLLRQERAAEALALLSGYDSMEPMLLRIALAQQQLGVAELAHSRELLGDAFDLEQRRGDAVHRREQARFLLDLQHQPAEALAIAQQNWRVQREPDDALILLRAAQAAATPAAAAAVRSFLADARLQDVRLDPYRSGAQP